MNFIKTTLLTVLLTVSTAYCSEIITLLLQNAGNPNIQADNGKTAEDILPEKGLYF